MKTHPGVPRRLTYTHCLLPLSCIIFISQSSELNCHLHHSEAACDSGTLLPPPVCDDDCPSMFTSSVSLHPPQRRLYHHRPVLGHQPGPAGLVHPLLAAEPRGRRLGAQWGESRHRSHHAHRLSAQVSDCCICCIFRFI